MKNLETFRLQCSIVALTPMSMLVDMLARMASEYKGPEDNDKIFTMCETVGLKNLVGDDLEKVEDLVAKLEASFKQDEMIASIIHKPGVQ